MECVTVINLIRRHYLQLRGNKITHPVTKQLWSWTQESEKLHVVFWRDVFLKAHASNKNEAPRQKSYFRKMGGNFEVKVDDQDNKMHYIKGNGTSVIPGEP